MHLLVFVVLCNILVVSSRTCSDICNVEITWDSTEYLCTLAINNETNP